MPIKIKRYDQLPKNLKDIVDNLAKQDYKPPEQAVDIEDYVIKKEPEHPDR